MKKSKDYKVIIMEQSKLPSKQQMQHALMEKDPAYEGVFIVGEKFTGIFCRPTCPIKKAKAESLEYFNNTQQALSMGYKPCETCSPMSPYKNEPNWLKPLLQKLYAEPSLKINDQAIRAMGLDPAKVRDWFKQHHGMTFQAFARALRLNEAFGLIKYNDKELDNEIELDNKAGLDHKVELNQKTESLIYITRILTPLGPMFAGASSKGICLLEFTDRRMLETQIKRLSKLLNATFIPGRSIYFKLLNEELKKYFNGKLTQFSVPLDYPGTDFQKKAWRQLLTINYGKTRSYQQQAIATGNAKAVRAVAKANGDNRISIIIPCHRLIGKNGELTGYGGGLWRKKQLLLLEQGEIKSE